MIKRHHTTHKRSVADSSKVSRGQLRTTKADLLYSQHVGADHYHFRVRNGFLLGFASALLIVVAMLSYFG